jgi:hypothetical protein
VIEREEVVALLFSSPQRERHRRGVVADRTAARGG